MGGTHAAQRRRFSTRLNVAPTFSLDLSPSMISWMLDVGMNAKGRAEARRTAL